ncbi:MAG: peptide chain release factor 1 [Thiobacillus sp.]|nr:peptide chain release factor 1 [Thiobacillus sp.]
MGAATEGPEIVRLSKEHAELRPVAEAVLALEKVLAEKPELEAMAADSDPDISELARDELERLEARLPDMERDVALLLAPRDKDENASAILEVRAGTGGDEAALFAGDLFRMYQRYAASRGWRVEIDSISEGEMGGFKEIIASITGDGVFGRLKFESGVHRVQRVPATEAQGRIHTSAATVAVLPEVEDVEIEINDADLRIDTYRSSGAGGQHVNKTDSAVRITHLPSGIVVQCQNDRSQHKNRAEAMSMLKSKMYEAELRKRQAEQDKLEAGKADVGWGHQIRSYVLDNSRIKDLRTNVEVSATQKVLDGDLDIFIEASLKQGV